MKIENCTLLYSLTAKQWKFREENDGRVSALKALKCPDGITVIKPVMEFSGDIVKPDEFASVFRNAIESYRGDEISRFKLKKEHPEINFEQTMAVVDKAYDEAIRIIDVCANADSTKFFQSMHKLGFESGILVYPNTYTVTFSKPLSFNPGNVFIMFKVTQYPFDDENLLCTFREYIDYYERNKESMIRDVIVKHPTYHSPEAAINEVIEVHTDTFKSLYKMIRSDDNE